MHFEVVEGQLVAHLEPCVAALREPVDKADLGNWLVLILGVDDLGVECELITEAFFLLLYETVASDVSALDF